MEKDMAADLKIYTHATGVLFGTGTVELVQWMEKEFPWGEWVRDEDDRPLYRVKGIAVAGLQSKLTVEEG